MQRILLTCFPHLVPDELTGEALAVFVVAKDGDLMPLAPSSEHDHGHRLRKETLKKSLVSHVRAVVGPFAAPKKLYIVPDLPKTRSGKSESTTVFRLDSF